MRSILPTIFLLFPLILPTGCKKTTQRVEVVPARVLTQGEVESFNLSGALGGYTVARCAGCDGATWGLIVGAGTAKGCKIPLMVEEGSLVLSAPYRACKDLKEGEIISVLKLTTTVHHGKTDEILSETVTYRWKW